MKRVTSFAIAIVISLGATAVAQQPAATDAARQDSVVRQAMRTYQQGLNDIKNRESPTRPAHGTSSGISASCASRKRSPSRSRKPGYQSRSSSRNRWISWSRDSETVPAGPRIEPSPTRSVPVADATIKRAARVEPGDHHYNARLTREVSKFGGNYSVSWSNQRVASRTLSRRRNPPVNNWPGREATCSRSSGLQDRQTSAAVGINLINREISEEMARGRPSRSRSPTCATPTGISLFTQSAVDVAVRATELADKLVETTRRASKSARSRRSTSCRLRRKPRRAGRTWPPPKPRRRQRNSPEAFLAEAPTTPMWRRRFVRWTCPLSRRRRPMSRARCGRALSERTEIINARKASTPATSHQVLQGPVDARAGRDRGELRRAGGWAYELVRTSGGLDASVSSILPGNYAQALSLLRRLDYPNWNFNVVMSYPLFGSQATAQHARARLQRNQAMTRIRALEVQIAAEVANAALTVQSNLKRVEAATAARELAQKRLEAERAVRRRMRPLSSAAPLCARRTTQNMASWPTYRIAVKFERAKQRPRRRGGTRPAQ